MANLYEWRNRDLGELAPKLYPFINAYRPHSKPQSWQDLKKAGYKRIIKDSFVDELEEVYFEIKGFYPEDNPELTAEG